MPLTLPLWAKPYPGLFSGGGGCNGFLGVIQKNFKRIKILFIFILLHFYESEKHFGGEVGLNPPPGYGLDCGHPEFSLFYSAKQYFLLWFQLYN